MQSDSRGSRHASNGDMSDSLAYKPYQKNLALSQRVVSAPVAHQRGSTDQQRSPSKNSTELSATRQEPSHIPSSNRLTRLPGASRSVSYTPDPPPLRRILKPQPSASSSSLSSLAKLNDQRTSSINEHTGSSSGQIVPASSMHDKGKNKATASSIQSKVLNSSPTKSEPGSGVQRSPMHHYSYASTLALQSREFSSPSRSLTPSPSSSQTLLEDTRTTKSTSSYLPHFQPKGVMRSRFFEFRQERDKHRSRVELEEQRMQRRLAKLVSIYNHTDANSEPLMNPPTHGNLLSRGSAQMLTLFQSKSHVEDQRRRQYLRTAEQSVVKWQEDAQFPRCNLCNIPFSLAVRRHHCRLCGRIVCSTPQLPPLLNDADQPAVSGERCSSLLVVDSDTFSVHEMPPQPASDAPQSRIQKYRQEARRAIRFCRECHEIILRISFRISPSSSLPIVNLYTLLLNLQSDILNALPEFHEMILGLQKNDANQTLASSIQDSRNLQSHAAQARKELLARFSQYDHLAKKIRYLPPIINQHPSNTEERLQRAIYARATLFLQKHMFPLQQLPASETKQSSRNPTQQTNGKFLSDHTQQQIRVLREQECLLDQYLAAAVKARNIDDIQALQANRDEIRSELARLQS